MIPLPRVALRKKHQCEAWVGGHSEQVVVGDQEDWHEMPTLAEDVNPSSVFTGEQKCSRFPVS